MRRSISIAGLVIAWLYASVAGSSSGFACACGCGVFDVATSSMLPEGPGGMAFVNYDFQDQNHNWSGGAEAPAANDPDKAIRTDFVTAGFQYMFNQSWGAQIEIPYAHRDFQTTGGLTGDAPVALSWTSLGDIRIKAMYTGFSPDLSAGITFGIKLPTGNYTHNDAYGDVDRDSEIGTGSTDLLLGGFYRRPFAGRPAWNWFAQAEWDQPILARDQYRPGAEIDSAGGIYYSGWRICGAKITPVLQGIASARASDRGLNAADPVASGYRRLLVSPGVEINLHPWSVYVDAELPVWQQFTGNQLAAPVLYKVIISHMF